MRKSQFIFLLLVPCAACSATSPNAAGSGLEERIKKLESAEEMRSLFDGADRVAYLIPSEKSYALAKADFGNLAVSLDDVSPYADGSKVKLTFGNTTSATAVGLNAKLEWGAADANGAQVGAAQNKTENFPDNLPAASWHSYEVILPHTPPVKLGFVRVSEIKSGSIRLSIR